jgi:4-hydroxy-2-oxoheptanedioate aldolase
MAAMQTPRNEFKARLRGGAPQLGLWLGLTDPVCIEIAAGAGFDWLCLDGEHSPHELHTLLPALQIIAAYPVQPIVRVPVGDPAIIKRVLDIGAQTVVVPMVESADQARRLVQAMRYPPHGARGVGTALARAARWNTAVDYFARANDEMCLIVQIESDRGLGRLEEIAAVDGVDALFIGPADLAASLGYLGNPAHQAVQQAIRAAFDRIRATGKPCGSLSADEAIVRDYLNRGCQFMGLGSDTTLLANATRQLARKFKPSGADEPASPRGQVY